MSVLQYMQSRDYVRRAFRGEPGINPISESNVARNIYLNLYSCKQNTGLVHF